MASRTARQRKTTTVALATLPPARRVGDQTLLRELRPELVRRVVAPARTIGFDMKPLGVSGIPSEELFYQQTPAGNWLVISDYLRDPTRTGLTRKIPVPPDQLARLVAIRDAGCDFDRIWVAHEIPETWQPGTKLPRLVPKPRPVREFDARLSSALIATLMAPVRAGAAIAHALDEAAARASERRARPRSVIFDDWQGGDSLDPIILGGLDHPVREAVVWFLLAQWEWE